MSANIGVFSARLSSVGLSGARPRPRGLAQGSSSGLGGGFSTSTLVAARTRAKSIVKRRASAVDAVETASSAPGESALGTVASVESLRQVKTRMFGVLSTKPDDRSDEQLDVLVRECSDIPFIQQFRRDQRRSLFRIVQMRDAPRGTVVAREGSRGTELYIVYFGTCAVVRRADASAAASDGLGAEQSILEPGDAFGERALLTDAGRRKASVVARTDSVILVITREAFLENFSNQVGWAPQVARTVMSKNKRTAEDLETVIVYLSSISWFRQLSRAELEAVVSSFKLLTLEENQPLYEKGDPVTSLWVVLSGRVALQPRAESMTAASPKARLPSRSLPSRVSKLNRSSARRISVLEAGFAPQSSENKDCFGGAHPSGNDDSPAADDSSIVWYVAGDAFGDAELRAHNGSMGAVGSYCSVEPTELLELPRASFDDSDFLGSLLDRHGVVFPMASCLEALKRDASTRTDRELRLILSLVDTISVFQHLPIPKRIMLCRSFTLQERPKGSVVCRQGEEGDTFYIVITGSVGIHIRKGAQSSAPVTSKRGGEPDADAFGSCVHVMTAGDSFGERSLLFNEPRSATCVAQGFCQLVCVKRNAFDAVADEDLVLAPRLSIEILKKQQTERTREAVHYLYNYVREIRFFRRLSPLMLTHLLPGLSHRSVARDALVFREGEKCGDVFVVLHGCVALHSQAPNVLKASRESHGSCAYMCDNRGDLFGEFEISDDATRQHTAVAKEDTELIVIAAAPYAALMKSEESSIKQEQCRRALLKDRSVRDAADVDLVFSVLHDNPFLAQLPKPKLRAVCRAVTLRDFESNDVICEQGADGDALYLIFSGSCDVFSYEYGASEEHGEAAAQEPAEANRAKNAAKIGDVSVWGRLVNVMQRGDGFGEASLQTGAARGATVVTRENAEIIRLDRADYDEILSNLDCRLAVRPNELSRRLQALQSRALRVGESDQVIRALKLKMLSELLRPLAVFAAMDDTKFARFCHLMRPLTVAADDQIYTAGAAPSFIAVLVVGSVEFFSPRGTLLHTARVGDQIGNLEVILDCPRLVEARAVRDSFVMVLSAAHYRTFWRSVHDEEQHTTAKLLRSFPSLLTMAAADQFSVWTTSQRRTFSRGTLMVAHEMRDEIAMILEGECECQLRLRNMPKHSHHAGAAKPILALATVGARTCFGDLWPRAEEHTLALECKSEVVMLMLPKPLVAAHPVVVEELTVGLSHVITWSATQMARPPVSTAGLGTPQIAQHAESSDSDTRAARRTMPISACEVPLVPNQPISHGADGFIALPDSQLRQLKSYGRRAASKVNATTSSPVAITAPPAKQNFPVVRPEDFSTRQLARAHRAVCPAMPANTYGRRFEHLALRTTKRPQLGPSSVLRGSNRQRRLVELFTHA